MRAPRSFRSRLLLGAVLGALGLLAIFHMLSLLLFRRYPAVFRLGHVEILIIFSIMLIVAGLLQVRRGLSPFDRLRARLSAVRAGSAQRIDESYPSEVQPLVNDLNDLLDHREQVVRRAVAKAGDLAHGLKTPLAVLAQEAERARADGHAELAAAINQQVERMRRQVDYHLAHARAAASGATLGARTSVKESADGLSRTLLRLHVDRGLDIRVNVSPEHWFRGQREDLDEMLGNLLDNACKWGRSRVTVQSSGNEARILITVDDDGPGLDAAMRDSVLQRGVRADEAAPGSGLGLAIVRDLAEVYGGAITLAASPTGGLRALLDLPA